MLKKYSIHFAVVCFFLCLISGAIGEAYEHILRFRVSILNAAIMATGFVGSVLFLTGAIIFFIIWGKNKLTSILK